MRHATEPSPTPARLRSGLSARQYFSLGFGSIIGVGWITMVGEWLQLAGYAGTLIGIAVGTALMMSVGACYAEMAAMMPQAGGPVAYARRSIGGRSAFIVGWMLVGSFVTTIYFLMISVVWLFHVLFPQWHTAVLFDHGGDRVEALDLVGVLGIHAALIFINGRGSAASGRVQDLLTFSKIALCTAFVLMALLVGHPRHLQPFFSGGGADHGALRGVAAVILTMPFFLAGFEAIAQGLEERRTDTGLSTIGHMLVLSIAAAGAFYALVTTATAILMPRAVLLASKLPAAAALEDALHSSILGKCVLIAGFLGLLTSWNASLFVTSRLIYSLARAGMIGQSLATIDERFGSPTRAVLLAGALSAFGVLFGRSALLPIVDSSSIASTTVYFVVCICVIRLRVTEGTTPRPFKVGGGLILVVTGAATSLGITLYALVDPLKPGSGIPYQWIAIAIWVSLGCCCAAVGAGKAPKIIQGSP